MPIPQLSAEPRLQLLGPNSPECQAFAAAHSGALKRIGHLRGEFERLQKSGVSSADARLSEISAEIASLGPKLRIWGFVDRKGAKWFFDAYEGDRPRRWIEKYCKHRKGEWAGRPFVLRPFQVRWVRQIFGWFGADGYRKHREAWIEIPRKNGKSTWAAAIALFLLVGDREPAAEVYSVAGNEDQARLVYNDACAMIDLSPELDRVVDYHKKIMLHGASGSTYRPLGKGNQHGLNPHGTVGDEVHEWKGREQYDAISTADGTRRQPLAVYITTAGYDIVSLCGELHRTALQVRAGVLYRPDLYVAIYAAKADDDWTSERVWLEANPGMRYGAPKIEAMRIAFNKAKSSKAEENNFKRFRLNIWTDSQTAWIPVDAWRGASRRLDFEKLKGAACFAGLDLAKVSDLSCLALLFTPANRLCPGKWVLACRFWCPEDDIHARTRADGVQYQAWADDGLLQKTPGNTTDFDFIERDILEISKQYDILGLGYDPHLAHQLIAHLDAEGVPCAEVRQGMLTLAPPTQEFERLVIGRELVHGGHDIMTWNIANVVVQKNAAGDYKPHKGKSGRRIDGAVAAINALALGMTVEVEPDLSAFLASPAIAA